MALAFQPILRFYRCRALWGLALPAIACAYMVFTLDSAYQHLRGRGGLWKGRVQANMSGNAMTTMTDISPTKTHRGENFPVASALIHPRHRETILAFYRFARASDDIADHPSLPENEKLARLQRMEDTLLGKAMPPPRRSRCGRALAKRGLAPRHAQDLLTAFRMDVTKRRYRDWDDLIGYCTYSAMPVGRFVLDVHGESRATWPANDALCAALQVINHLQDCGADYRRLDRVYIPLDALDRHGLTVDALAADKASPELRAMPPGSGATHVGFAARRRALFCADQRSPPRSGGFSHSSARFEAGGNVECA